MNEKWILLVEDNADDEALTLRALKKNNLLNKVIVARDGLQVLERIRAEELSHLLPVVILTTSSEDVDRVKSYKLGANSFIRKPVDFKQFSEAIQQLGIYWLVVNQSPYARIT